MLFSHASTTNVDLPNPIFTDIEEQDFSHKLHVAYSGKIHSIKKSEVKRLNLEFNNLKIADETNIKKFYLDTMGQSDIRIATLNGNTWEGRITISPIVSIRRQGELATLTIIFEGAIV